MKNLMFLFLCLSICVQAAELRGRVVAVSDGDTVTVLDAERQQHKVRLAGIDLKLLADGCIQLGFDC